MPETLGGVQLLIDKRADVVKAIRELSKKQILVGIPQEKATRKGGGKVSNAVIGYISEFGSPKHNIPARPFLVPTIKGMKADIVNGMGLAGAAAVEGQRAKMNSILNSLGLKAVAEVKKTITSKIPPPLAHATVLARLRRTQAGRNRMGRMRKKGINFYQWGSANLTPLVDTSDFYNSITYVIRDRKGGK